MHKGELIRETREALGLTQQELGAMAGLHHTAVSRIERGLYDAPRRTIKALNDALGKALAERGAA